MVTDQDFLELSNKVVDVEARFERFRNDTNFQQSQIVSTIQRNLSETENRLNAKHNELKASIDAKFAGLESKIINSLTDKFDAKIEGLENKIINSLTDKFDVKFAGLESKIINSLTDKFDAKIENLEYRLTIKFGKMLVTGIVVLGVLITALDFFRAERANYVPVQQSQLEEQAVPIPKTSLENKVGQVRKD